MKWSVGREVPPVPDTHIVQFYDSEKFLFEIVAAFLLEGAQKRQSLLILATPAHSEGITSILRADGVDTMSIVTVDARELKSAVMTGDMPDEQRFRSTIGALIEKAAGSQGAHVMIYGEIADLLMCSGQWEASLRLEEFWNDFAASHEFSILCAHSLENFYDDSAAALLHEVCRRHGRANPAA